MQMKWRKKGHGDHGSPAKRHVLMWKQACQPMVWPNPPLPLHNGSWSWAQVLQIFIHVALKAQWMVVIWWPCTCKVTASLFPTVGSLLWQWELQGSFPVMNAFSPVVQVKTESSQCIVSKDFLFMFTAPFVCMQNSTSFYQLCVHWQLDLGMFLC